MWSARMVRQEEQSESKDRIKESMEAQGGVAEYQFWSGASFPHDAGEKKMS